jgi:glycosyltransferase involved in cell wall biosynthesis
LLIRSLADVPDRNWHLTCAGSLDRDPAAVERLRSTMNELALDDRMSLVGELGEAALARVYRHADLFVLATLRETYGMAVAEALARGLPVVSTMTGAIPNLVGHSGDAAGILVAPGDVQALTDALSHVIGDAQLRGRLAENARRVRDWLPTWEDAGAQFADALDRFTRERRRRS